MILLWILYVFLMVAVFWSFLGRLHLPKPPGRNPASLMPTSMGTKPLSWPIQTGPQRGGTVGLSLKHNHAKQEGFYIYPWVNDRYQRYQSTANFNS